MSSRFAAHSTRTAPSRATRKCDRGASDSGHPLPHAGPEPEFANTEAAAANAERKARAAGEGRPRGIADRRSERGDRREPKRQHRDREDRSASRSVRSPHENRIGFGFPCSGAERDLRGSFSSRQVREVREGWFPVFRCGLCGLCVRFLRGVGRRVAGCGAEPRQTNQTTCGRVPLDAAKQAGAALCSGRALCSFSTRSTTRLAPATPSLVRAKAGSGDAPAVGHRFDRGRSFW